MRDRKRWVVVSLDETSHNYLKQASAINNVPMYEWIKEKAKSDIESWKKQPLQNEDFAGKRRRRFVPPF